MQVTISLDCYDKEAGYCLANPVFNQSQTLDKEVQLTCRNLVLLFLYESAVLQGLTIIKARDKTPLRNNLLNRTVCI